MRAHMEAAGSQAQKMAMLRRYGWGVPDLGRALMSASNDATLMVEDALLPFRKDGTLIRRGTCIYTGCLGLGTSCWRWAT